MLRDDRNGMGRERRRHFVASAEREDERRIRGTEWAREDLGRRHGVELIALGRDRAEGPRPVLRECHGGGGQEQREDRSEQAPARVHQLSASSWKVRRW